MANSLAVLIATHDKLNIFTSTAADMCKRHILYVAVEKYEIRFRPEKKHTLTRATTSIWNQQHQLSERTEEKECNNIENAQRKHELFQFSLYHTHTNTQRVFHTQIQKETAELHMIYQRMRYIS